MQRKIELSADLDALSGVAARRWATLAAEAIAARGEFHVALSGGATPRRLYERLAAAPFVHEIAWSRVHIYFTDERCVPADHRDSNFRMASEALLRHVSIPPGQIHRIEVGLATLRQDAAAYAEVLRKHLPMSVAGMPQFDLVLLGLGPDGHIASLFPAGGIAITEREDRYAVAVYADRLKAWRISLSLPILAHASHIMMLAAGDEKAAIVRRALDVLDSPPLPVQRLQPVHEMEWYLDEAAAQLCDRGIG